MSTTELPASWRAFLWQQGLALGSLSGHSIIEDFQKQMQLGLNVKPKFKASLAMLPAYLRIPAEIPNEKTIIAIDAGGTNLRCALASFRLDNGQSHCVFEQSQHHPMPGTQGPVSKEEFYQTLFKYIEPLLDQSDTVGFCFSYPCEISNDYDGRLLYWTKEVDASGVENTWLGKELNQIITSKGYDAKRFVLLNDTVATLLSSRLHQSNKDKVESNQAYIGLILGTGMNCAYSASTLHTVTNIESGAYNGVLNNLVDSELDNSSLDPNQYPFEKKVAGRYLGELALRLFEKACDTNLLSEQCKSAIAEYLKNESYQLDTANLNTLLIPDAKGDFFNANSEDKSFLRFIVESLLERAARICAYQLVAISKQCLVEQLGDKAPEILINIEGSTYYQLHSYEQKIRDNLERLMSKEGLAYQVYKGESSSLSGAAIAALSI